jgi:hypothetical protein
MWRANGIPKALLDFSMTVLEALLISAQMWNANKSFDF